MKKYFSAAAIALFALVVNTDATGQDRDQKEKSKNKLADHDEIIIKRKEIGKDGKIIIEIKEGEVMVNGKPIEEYEDDNISVRSKKSMTYNLDATSPFRHFDNDRNFLIEEDRSFLGVITEEENGGAKITAVTKNSAAEKAGLMKGDIITKVNDERVQDQEDLTTIIGKLKPNDKVALSFKRDGKENKATATLGKRAVTNTIFAPNLDFEFNHNLNLDHDRQMGQFPFYGRPRIGIKAQDTEDGKGVKVLDVHEGSVADKSGIRKDDVITEFEGKAVNSADELADASREFKDKSSIKIKLNRGGSSQTVDIKIPKKLKTANL